MNKNKKKKKEREKEISDETTLQRREAYSSRRKDKKMVPYKRNEMADARELLEKEAKPVSVSRRQ